MGGLRFKLESPLDTTDSGWSSDRICKGCGDLESECRCRVVREILEPKMHRLKVLLEKRRGKSVTILSEFFMDEANLKKLLKDLKSRLSVGGAIKECSIELQGDCRVRAKEILLEIGFRFKV